METSLHAPDTGQRLLIGRPVTVSKDDEVLHGVIMKEGRRLVIDWEIGGMTVAFARKDGWIITAEDGTVL